MRLRAAKEFVIEKLIFLSGIASIVFVALIFVFLLKEGISLFKTITPGAFLSGRFWYPISDPPKLGILPLILGSLMVTAGAIVLAVPLGIASAFYIAEIAPAACATSSNRSSKSCPPSPRSSSASSA